MGRIESAVQPVPPQGFPGRIDHIAKDCGCRGIATSTRSRKQQGVDGGSFDEDCVGRSADCCQRMLMREQHRMHSCRNPVGRVFRYRQQLDRVSEVLGVANIRRR